MSELHELFMRLEADTLDTDACSDLERRLAEPSVRSAWRRHLIDSALLHEDCAAERRLAIAAPIRSPSWWRPAIAALLLIGVVLIIIALHPVPSGPARVVATRGDATITAPDGTWLMRGDPLAAGSRLQTGSDASLRLAFPDGSAVDLAADSACSLTAERRVAVRLERGRLEAVVARQAADRPALFASPEAEATVLGTRFTLTSLDGATRLAVSEGRVRLATSDGAAVVAGAGQTGTARSEPVPILFLTGDLPEQP